MGRELKRVPLDFEWSRKQIWKGYINPYNSQKCKICDQTGYNEATKKIADGWYSFDKAEWVYPDGPGYRYNNLAWSNHITDVEVDALMKEGRLSDFTRGEWVWYDEKKKSWVKMVDGKNGKRKEVKCEKPKYPTAEEVNNWSRGRGMGHDAINQGICVEARAKHLGVYGKCPCCKGAGEIWQSSKIKKLADKWKPIEPPKGKGYQLWETTSDGTPCSPVFNTLEKLCEWCETNATTFADFKTTKEKWMEMLKGDNVHQEMGKVIFV